MLFMIAVQLCCFLFTICAHVEDCIGQQCSEVVSIPLLDNMKATLKADLDVAELNKVLQKYIQQEVTKAVKGTFVNQMEGTVEQITDNVTRLMQLNVNAKFVKFQDCQCSNRETTPAFSSVLTHAQSVSANAAIKFDRVIINIQDGYDPTTGIFTAPSNGVYHISSTVMNSKGKTLFVSLYLNDVTITSIWLNPASQTYEMGTTNMILDLKEGDKVTIRSRGSYTVHSNLNIHSSFSGYLILK
ncbi:COL8A [Mytilus coruscus]|uniref:COL8A n=1 Tax=Mytilus coruscus TaxID=42192 RepID=A0A6J8E7A1_MYTCO|nr:COL8A [Mytilus coruscus]